MDKLDAANTTVTEKKTKTVKSAKKPATKRKTTAVKTAAAKTTVAKSTRTKKKAAVINVSDEQRLSMIAEAAYFKAEKRGFIGGTPEEDWLAAESEVNALLSNNPSQQANA
jgi:hypothetical protein